MKRKTIARETVGIVNPSIQGMPLAFSSSTPRRAGCDLTSKLALVAAYGAALAFGITLFASPSPSEAANFDFSNCATIISAVGGVCPGNTAETSLTYSGTGTSATISVTGFNAAGTTKMNLFDANNPPPGPESLGGSGRNGLGLSGDVLGSNEISSADYVSTDLTNIFANAVNPGTITATLIFDGIQFPPDEVRFCQSTSATVLGTACTNTIPTGILEAQIPVTLLSANGDFLNVTAVAGDVREFGLFDVSVKAPEPSSLVLLSVALAGLVFAVRRRKVA